MRWTACDGIRLRATETGYIVTGTHLPEPVVVNDSIDLLTDRTFHLRGRSDDQIKIAGRRTSLSALNAILASIDGVKDGAFFAVEARHNPERQRLIAFVVAPDLSPAQVAAALRRNLDRALMPHQIRLVAHLPRTPAGKLPIATLAELAAQQPDSDEL